MSIPQELELLFEAFDRNARVNREILATVDVRDLDYGDGVGGFSIGQHLADVVGFRRDWLSRVSPEHADRLADATDPDAPNWLKVGTIAELQDAFDDGDAAIRDAVLDAVRAGRRFERAYASHPAQLLVHCLVHDAHHRGQILALLRQSGRGAEERERLEDATWPIWRVSEPACTRVAPGSGSVARCVFDCLEVPVPVPVPVALGWRVLAAEAVMRRPR